MPDDKIICAFNETRECKEDCAAHDKREKGIGVKCRWCKRGNFYIDGSLEDNSNFLKNLIEIDDDDDGLLDLDLSGDSLNGIEVDSEFKEIIDKIWSPDGFVDEI